MSQARSWIPASAAILVTLGMPSPAAAQATSSAGSVALSQASSVVAFTVYAKAFFTIKREGRFKDVSGEASFDPANPADTHIDMTVYTASLDMHNSRDETLLRSGDFFDVEHFPTMHFSSAEAYVKPDGTVAVSGNLTIRGITKRMDVPIKVTPTVQSGAPSSAAFETTFDIDRTEFGLVGTPSWSGFKVSISKNVQIHIAIAAPFVRK